MPIRRVAHEVRVNVVSNEIVMWGHKVFDDGTTVECEVARISVESVLADAADKSQIIGFGVHEGELGVIWENFFAAALVEPPSAPADVIE